MMANVMTLVMSFLKTVPSSLVPRVELCKNQSLVKKSNELQYLYIICSMLYNGISQDFVLLPQVARDLTASV